MFHFPISGVDTYWWLPLVVAFVVSLFSSLGGLSGAFLLLPFQVSILKFTGPGVSPTNLVFNIVAIPSGVYRYWKEGRMVWPLAWATMIGTLPGIFLGAVIRIQYLPNPRNFKLFVGLVLLYIGSRLAQQVFQKTKAEDIKADNAEKFLVTQQKFNLRCISYQFREAYYSAPTWGILLLSFIVGIIGGIYGIGGGAIIAPFFVTVFKLPIYTIAGASLFGTFVTSVAGVAIFSLLALCNFSSSATIRPDWMLGLLFGIGGALGIYLGARIQKLVPGKIIKAVLTFCVLSVVVKYIGEFFSH